MLLAEINNAVDDGPLFVSPSTVNASAAIHQGLSSINSICHCVCCEVVV